jgi:ribosomal protein S1
VKPYSVTWNSTVDQAVREGNWLIVQCDEIDQERRRVKLSGKAVASENRARKDNYSYAKSNYPGDHTQKFEDSSSSWAMLQHQNIVTLLEKYVS